RPLAAAPAGRPHDGPDRGGLPGALRRMSRAGRQALKRLLGPRWTTRARGVLRGQDRPRWGNLRRVVPFSVQFGFDRGLPVDRYYLEKFLERHRSLITGLVLEIQSATYAERYGRAVRRAESVDVDPRVRPTFVCDLADSESVLASERYDC